MSEVALGRDGEPVTHKANLPEKSRREELNVLLTKAMSGQIPRDRDLKDEEPDVLSPAHIQIILLKAGGMKQRAIAELLDYTEGRVSTIVNHPDAQYLIHKILGYAADSAVDVPTRLRAGSAEMLGIVADVARGAEKEETKLKAAFGWLDRAGHGKIETQKHEHSMSVSEKGASRLAGAIKEAMEVEKGEDVSRFVVSGDERVSSESQAIGLLQSGPASTDEPPIRGSNTGTTPLDDSEENAA